MSVIMTNCESGSAYLVHYRTKGSPNGVRRYQNEDGSLTPLGRIHYGVGEPRQKAESVSEDSKSPTEATQEKPLSKKQLRKQQKAEAKAKREALTKERQEISNLSDADLQARINRLNKEKQLSQLLQEQAASTESPLKKKAVDLLSNAAENLAKKTMDAVVEKIANQAKEQLNKTKPFDLEQYRDKDLFTLKSDEVEKVQKMFESLGKIAENRGKMFTNNENTTPGKAASEKKKTLDEQAKEAKAKKEAAEKEAKEEKKAAEREAKEEKKAAEKEAKAAKEAAEKEAKAAKEAAARKAEADKKAAAEQRLRESRLLRDSKSNIKNTTIDDIHAMKDAGYSVKEIAESLNLTEETIKKIV